MVFSVNKKDISDKLQHLMNVIPSKTTMMVLSNFRIDADSETNKITIIATDLNITTIVKINSNVVESGSTLVSAKHLHDIINSLPDSAINFSLKEETLVIECGKSNFTINCIDTSLFPEIAFIENANEFSIDAANFKKLIQNTSFCVSTESIHNIMNGVYLKIEDNLITMAATDTKRIGEAKLKTDFLLREPNESVLPPRALNFIDKNITSDVDDIILKFDERRVSVYLPDIVVICNKFEGRFPNYTVAFKNCPEKSLLVSKGDLKDAIKRVSLLSEDEDKLIKVSLGESEIIVESLISERGNAKESITGFSYDGDNVVFGINSRLLSALVNAVETDDVIMKINLNTEPIWILNNTTYEDIEIRYVVMPMRIDNIRQ